MSKFQIELLCGAGGAAIISLSQPLNASDKTTPAALYGQRFTFHATKTNAAIASNQ